MARLVLYIAADDDDLWVLKASIDRALEKSKALRKIVKNYPDRSLGDSIGDGSKSDT